MDNEPERSAIDQLLLTLAAAIDDDTHVAAVRIPEALILAAVKERSR